MEAVICHGMALHLSGTDMKTYKEFLAESAEPKFGKFVIKSEFGGFTDYKYDTTDKSAFNKFLAKKVIKSIPKGASNKDTAFTVATLYRNDKTKNSDMKAAFRISQVISNEAAIIVYTPNYMKGHPMRSDVGLVVGDKFYGKDNIPAEYKKYF